MECCVTPFGKHNNLMGNIMKKSLAQIAHEKWATKYHTPAWNNLTEEMKQFWKDMIDEIISKHENRNV